jgi:hypothetical protein
MAYQHTMSSATTSINVKSVSTNRSAHGKYGCHHVASVTLARHGK